MSDWTPKVGALVWLNHPDADEPLGRVVGFVTSGPRQGQPIIEVIADEPPPFGRKAGDRIVCHPAFLLPWRFRGPEWLAAEAKGRIR